MNVIAVKFDIFMILFCQYNKMNLFLDIQYALCLLNIKLRNIHEEMGRQYIRISATMRGYIRFNDGYTKWLL